MAERDRPTIAAPAADDVRARIDELEEIYHSAPIGLCLVDAEFRFLRINDRLAAISGRSPADLIGKSVEEVVPELAAQVLPRYRKVLETGQPIENVEVSNPETGRTWLVSDHPLRGASDRVTGIITVVQDTTALKRSEEETRLGRARLRRAERVAQLGCWEWNVQTGESWWSHELFRIFGREPDSVEPSYDVFIDHVASEDRARLGKQLDALYAGVAPASIEYRIIDANGQERKLRGIATLRRDEEGQPLMLFGTTQDLTEEQARVSSWEEERAALIRQRDELEALLIERTGALDRALDRIRRRR